MFSRLGRVIYWATCLIACGLVVVGVIVGIRGEWDVFALSLVSIPPLSIWIGMPLYFFK